MLFRQAGSQQFIPSGREKTILDAPLVKNASADSSLAAASPVSYTHLDVYKRQILF